MIDPKDGVSRLNFPEGFGNRLSISLSVLFSETQNSEGAKGAPAKVPPLTTALLSYQLYFETSKLLCK